MNITDKNEEKEKISCHSKKIPMEIPKWKKAKVSADDLLLTINKRLQEKERERKEKKDNKDDNDELFGKM